MLPLEDASLGLVIVSTVFGLVTWVLIPYRPFPMSFLVKAAGPILLGVAILVDGACCYHGADNTPWRLLVATLWLFAGGDMGLELGRPPRMSATTAQWQIGEPRLGVDINTISEVTPALKGEAGESTRTQSGRAPSASAAAGLGVLCFGVGHIVAVILLLINIQISAISIGKIIGISFVLLLLLTNVALISRATFGVESAKKRAALKCGLGLYCCLLSLMCSASILRDRGNGLMVVGAVLFVISDGLIGASILNLGLPAKVVMYSIWPTYYCGICLWTIGLRAIVFA